MNRHGNSKLAAGVRAFPLLAVLICTTGALVVLLVATARHARIVSQAAAQEQALSLHDEAQTTAADRELAELRVAQLKTARDKTAAQLEDERLKLSHLEDHLRRLREQVAGLQASAEELDRTGSQGAQQRSAAEGELANLQASVAAAKDELAKAEASANSRQVSYSVIPYQGPNQTRRRPIYIECTLDSVIIQPEGITLYAADFEGPLGPGNPLAAALRAIQEQIAAQEAAAGAEKSEPYPLLLVRPDGIVAYYAARTALSSWGSEFGYEMVEQEWNLEFPPSDGRLTEAARVALAEAREKQRQIAAAAPRHYPKNSKPTFHARPRGGFEQQGGPRGKHGRGGDSPWERGHAAGRSARPGGAGGNGADEPDVAGSNNANSALAGRYQSGSGQPDGSAGGALGGNSPESGGDGRYGDGRYAQSAGTGSGQEESIFGQGGAGTETAGTARGGGSGQSNVTSPGAGTGTNSAYASLPTGTGQGSASSRDASGQSGQTGQLNQAGQAGKQGAGKSEQDVSGSKGNAGSGGNGQLPQPADVVMRNQSKASGPQGTGGTADGSGAQNAKTSGGNAASGGASSSDSPTAAGMPNSGGPGGASGQPAGTQDPTATPTITAQLNKKKPTSLAEARGSDWGLPNAGNGSTAVTRPIIVECRPDRLVILPESGSGAGKTIPIVGETNGCVDDLVSGVWQHMKSWGIAGRGLYWKPTLVMVVAPGAERRYSELEALLNDSGMEVKQRAAKPPVADNSKNKRK